MKLVELNGHIYIAYTRLNQILLSYNSKKSFIVIKQQG